MSNLDSFILGFGLALLIIGSFVVWWMKAVQQSLDGIRDILILDREEPAP